MYRHVVNSEGFHVESFNDNREISQDYFVIDKEIQSNEFVRLKWDFNTLEWIEGATAEEIEEARKSQIPDPISRMRLKMQLIRMGISLGSILDAIGQIPDEIERDLTFTMWNDAVTFNRYDAQLNAMASMLGITQDQLDYIFIEGNK